MKLHRYNHDKFEKSEISEILVNSIIKKIEQSKFNEIPKQNALVQKLREAGWDEKVRVGKHCNHAIDGILEETGICVYFGHSQGAFVKILTFQSLYEDKKIKECYYITQSSETAELRHKVVNPKARQGSNGNRITFDNMINGMSYYNRFITVPMTIIGIEIDNQNLFQ